MKKEMVNKSEIKLVGLSVRTNNKNEMNPATSKIGGLAGRFWNENIAAKIPQRTKPGVTLSAYTDYASDEHGDYTYFIGEEVSSLENIPSDLQQLIIPAATYQKFTTLPGKMPEVVIQAWQSIWQMTPEDLGSKRKYQTDFEVYDERAQDFSKAEVDIYIGVD